MTTRQDQTDKERGVRAFMRDERGVIALVFAFCIPIFVGFAVLAIDIGYAYWTRNSLQVTASSSALAGVAEIVDDASDGVPDTPDTVRDAAVVFAEKNMGVGRYGGDGVLVQNDVYPGNWDPATRTFTRAGTYNPTTGAWSTAPGVLDRRTLTFTTVSDPVAPLNAVLAVTRRAQANDNELNLLLAPFLGLATADVNTAAIATRAGGGPLPLDNCIQALDEDDCPGLRMDGGAQINAPNCSIQVNQTCACGNGTGAVDANGIPQINIDGGSLNVSGSYCPSGNVTLSGALNEGVDADPDPFANYNPYANGDLSSQVDLNCSDPNLPSSVSVTDRNGASYSIEVFQDNVPGQPYNITGEQTIQPGVYCGGLKWTANGTATFTPGEYLIIDGPLSFVGSIGIEMAPTNTQSPYAGETGVGFFLEGADALVNMGGVTGVDLSAPQRAESPLLGFLMMSSKIDPPIGVNKIHGTNGSGLEGVLYFPDVDGFDGSGDVRFTGTSDTIDPSDSTICTMLIAGTIRVDGDATVTTGQECGDFDLPPTDVADLVLRLVD
jgi:Flp pilus assembly protein TadG